MIKTLLNIDLALLKWINHDLSNPLFDVFFPFWTDFQKQPFFLFAVLPLILVVIFYKKNWHLLKIIVLAALVTWVADNINHFFFKSFFQRSRPQDVILRIGPHASFSFPSGHAVDAFCLAIFLSLFYPRKKVLFLGLAALTALSRVYCGVHYPSDVLAGALVGSGLGYLFYRILMLRRLEILTMCFFMALGINSARAWEDPTQGKPFFPWVWEDQFKPTLKKSVDKTGLLILGSGVTASFATQQFDKKIHYYNRDHRLLFDEQSAKQMGKLGNGVFGLGIAVTQIVFDQQNGLRHMRALILTTTSHIAAAALVKRDRPENNTDFLPYPSSYPSGHASSAFATAGALAYSYGWKAGAPAYFVASGIALSRIRLDRHWASDIVAGAFLGTFWARASYKAEAENAESVLVVPTPIYDGMMITAIKEF